MTSDEKTDLIADIRRRLPFVAMGHPALADEIGRAMDMVEAGESFEARLANAMLEARAGASGDFDGAEQMRRTILMAEWIIARLPFHGLALVEQDDGLTDEERHARYMKWLRSRNAQSDA
jgi:hypothetical protein